MTQPVQPTEEQRKAYEEQEGKYYQLTGGTTVGMTVAIEGEVVEGTAFGYGWKPLSEEEQVDKFGRVIYKEYEASEDEDDVAAIHALSTKIRAFMGMQSPDMPPVDPATGAGQPALATMSRDELRAKAKTLGLNFGADTDREQMLGAIEKKEREAASEEPEDEPEPVKKRRAHAKEVIEHNNEVATGSTGSSESGSSAPEEEETP